MAATYNIIDFTDDVDQAECFNRSHIQVETTFKVAGSGSNMIPVNVKNPDLVITNSSGEVVVPDYLLRPLGREDNDDTGKYWATFLSEGLPEDTYTLAFSGTYGIEKVTDTGTLILKAVLNTQYAIDLVRQSLGDYRNIALPRKYLTFPITNTIWKDGELYNFLKLAIDDMNNAIPITPDEFTIENCPVMSFIIMGAQIYAINAIQSIEIANLFDFAAGTIHVDLYKGDKYAGLATFIEKNYFRRLEIWKKWYSFSKLRPRVINMRRVPIRISRPISDTLYYHSLRSF